MERIFRFTLYISKKKDNVKDEDYISENYGDSDDK